MPEYLEVAPGDSFVLTIVVEPNGQEVSVVEVVIRFDPDFLVATSSRLNPDSPLRTRLVPNDYFDNTAGTVILSAGPHRLLEETPTETFTLGSLTFTAKQVEATTALEFIRVGSPNTIAGLEGVYITGDLFGSTIEIALPPTPTPTPTETPTPTPTPTPAPAETPTPTPTP
ncbi:MAG: hypothetical protein IIC24_08025 [Chloroflexi bacterium]|nr:hypothetical protein [Chloroflexota bacterium]